jgi:predicted kinase
MSRSGCVNEQGTRGRLYALCGLPQAGKSTAGNAWVKGAPPGRPRVVLAGDDFRVSVLGAEYVPSAEHLIFSFIDTAAAALLRRGFDVLIDETSTSKPSLCRYLRLDHNFELLIIDTSAEECKRRALANNRPYLIPVIDRLSPRLEFLKMEWHTLRQELLEQIEHRLSTDVVIGLLDNSRPLNHNEAMLA